MAITTLATPQFLTPSFNPMYFYFNSTVSSELGFRYIITVTNDTTSEVIGTYKLKPIPNTLYGEIDIAKLVQTQLYNDFRQLTSYIADGHQVSYTVTVDESYFVNLAFTDYGFAGAATWPDFGTPSINPNGFSRTMLAQATAPIYSAGDVILVAQTPSANFRPELDGIHTVLDVFLSAGVYYTVLDLGWIGSGGVSDGFSSFADGQKTTVSGITTRVKKAYKGAFGFMTFKDYNHTQYICDGNGKQFLTTISNKNQIRISRQKSSWLSCYLDNATSHNVVFDIGGTLYRYPLTSMGENVILFDALPSDDTITEEFSGTWIPFTGTIDLTNVTSYTVQIREDDDTLKSQAKTINLYSECDEHTTYDICFLDRLGSWITIPFYKGSYMNQAVQRDDIRKKYGTLDGGNWTYNATDNGDETYHVEETISYTVNTGILSQDECQYMRELLSSPQAFVSIDGGDFQSIKITSASMPLHLKRTQRDRKVNLVFTMSVQDEING
jgi:hypothetical protein